jgi:hypothetical protein
LSAQTAGQTDHRALLATIRGRLVRAVANEETPYATALWEIVKQRSRSWTNDEWTAAELEIDTSKATIAEFLDAEHARARA